mgnify:CR=1 FL=1
MKKTAPKIAASITPPVMTTEKFADLTGVTHQTVVGLIKKGHLPSIKIGRRRWVNVAAFTRELLGE